MAVFICNSIQSRRSIFFVLVLFLLPMVLLGQELEWVYGTKGLTNGNVYIPQVNVNHITTNDNNEIFLAGVFEGIVDFGDNQDGFVYGNNLFATTGFIAKLNENKEVLWVKHFRHNFYFIKSILIDSNGNILLGGYSRSNSTALYMDPNPSNPNFPNIFDPTHENLIPDRAYGFILKLDPQGNYIDTRLFENTLINNITKDQNNYLVAVGNTVIYNNDGILTDISQQWGYVTKLDASLNTIWEKTLTSQNTNSNNGFKYVACDSQNNIYCSGNYSNSFVFGSTTLEGNGESQFVSKLTSNGNESWIVELFDNSVSPLRIDSLDNIYFFATYSSSFSVQFNNQLVSNLPVIEDDELVLFKINTNGSHIWNVPMYGIGQQEILDFAINTLGEIIIPIKSGMNTVLNFTNENTTIATNNSNAFLLKVKSNGELIDYKRIYENTIEDRVFPLSVHTDLNNNILLGGCFDRSTDFNPNPFDEYVLNPNLFQFQNSGFYFHEVMGFLLKLKNCETLPFFDDRFNFCDSENSNPTIADIKPSGLNVKWYVSMASQTPLAPMFPLTDGETYFYENIVENCSNIGRFPLEITILPQSNPPVIGVVQPCYYTGLKLSDIDIQGQNLLFYLAASGGESVSDETLIDSNTTYYVTQNDTSCESERIPFSVYQMTLLTYNYSVSLCDEDKNEIEIVNLSEYNQFFISSSSNGYVFSYFTSHSDALNDVNSILNYTSYQATNQTVFVRIFSTSSDCFEIVELSLIMVYPPEIDKIKVVDLMENNTITVLPYHENHVYSLDGINYQTSNYFDNLGSGEYSLYVKNNLLDCVSVSDTFYVLAYPKFFTPNGDGINDYWRIKFSQFQFLINIEVYDRYGKLITSFDKNSIGWDGKYNQEELPSNDYWFKIIRMIDKEIIYKGHFSLKR